MICTCLQGCYSRPSFITIAQYMEPDMLKEKRFLLAHDSECLEDQDWTATSGQNLMLLQLMMEKQKRNES